MPSFLAMRCAVATATLAALLAMPHAALALGPDEDPIPSFAHLQDQRNEVRNQVSELGATVESTGSGGFEITTAAAGRDIPSGAALRGATRVPELASSRFDPLSGVMTFFWPGIGTVRVTPSDRMAPRSIFADGTVVSATHVDTDVSEVTLASPAFLEQHLVVDEQHAANKLIEWSYQLELPAGVSTVATEGGMNLVWNDLPLMVVRATIAVDQAGNEYPVNTTWDADSKLLQVSYDGRVHEPTGAVAIDPVFLHSSLDQMFVMKVCQNAQRRASSR